MAVFHPGFESFHIPAVDDSVARRERTPRDANTISKVRKAIRPMCIAIDDDQVACVERISHMRSFEIESGRIGIDCKNDPISLRNPEHLRPIEISRLPI